MSAENLSPSEARKALEAAISDEYFNTPNILAAADLYASAMQQEAQLTPDEAGEIIEELYDFCNGKPPYETALYKKLDRIRRREGGTKQ